MARDTYLVAVSNGGVFMGYSPVEMTQATNGASALAADVPVRMEDGPPSPNDSSPTNTHRMMYFVDDGSNYARLDAHENEVLAWDAFNGTDVITNETIGGSMPEDGDGNKATIIAQYRNRIVLSGVKEDPANWFMSAVGDPRNWDYSPPTTSATQAVAGNASDAGEVGDRVTALAPLNDDIMLIGGDQSLWQMTGDPADGGALDVISYQTGITGPDAWAIDPAGRVYFMGQPGLFRFAGTGEPELVSRGRFDRTFRAFDLVNTRVLLQWDRQRDGLWIFVADENTDEVREHYWYDQRTDSFWPIELPISNGPYSVTTFDTDAPSDREVLLGGQDGYIRGWRDVRNADADGDLSTGDVTDAAISSFVDLGPIIGPPDTDYGIDETTVILDASAASVTAAIYAATTPERLASAAAAFSRAVVGGRNTPLRQRARGNAIKVRLSHDTVNEDWAMEGVQVKVSVVGRSRKVV
jgi:hypothetical protein